MDESKYQDRSESQSESTSVGVKGSETDETTEKTKKGGCCAHVNRPAYLLYVAHFLSAWGDRMWHFSVGLYLVYLDNKSLRLAAIYGFSNGASVLLFGSLIGDWVDRNRRLKVVRTYLFLQNSAVILCAISVFLRLQYKSQILSMLNGHMPRIMEAIVIILAIMAQLASVGTKIAIEKDWIVVVADKDRDQLANLNAATRAIDQLCKILAPLAVGQVMTFASLKVAAAAIAGWNLVSMFIEFSILYTVYKKVPALQHKEIGSSDQDDPDASVQTPKKGVKSQKITHLFNVTGSSGQDDPDASVQTPKKGVMALICVHFNTIFKGWPIYIRQKVVFAGLSLSGLYMTVLGFDSITIGYAYALNVPESALGICMGLGGATGLLATFIYPKTRKRIGLERTGLFAFAAEIICLSFCVISIWAPGSPSNMYKDAIPVQSGNCSITAPRSINLHKQFAYPETDEFYSGITTTAESIIECLTRPYTSIILFLIGIISSRVGLWMADLSVTQIFQENVASNQIGIVNGVQNSFNMLLDMLKFLLVIILPKPHTFGILILLSFLFIFMSGCLFAFHSWRIRGHLFHFNKILNKSGSVDITSTKL